MEQQDSTRFFELLNAMGVMFSDQLSKPRQKLYWEVMQHAISLEEWEYAACSAMQRETFHKVPLPGALMDYVREHRTMVRQHQALAIPRTEQQVLALREKLVAPEEIRKLIAAVWPGQTVEEEPL